MTQHPKTPALFLSSSRLHHFVVVRAAVRIKPEEAFAFKKIADEIKTELWRDIKFSAAKFLFFGGGRKGGVFFAVRVSCQVSVLQEYSCQAEKKLFS